MLAELRRSVGEAVLVSSKRDTPRVSPRVIPDLALSGSRTSGAVALVRELFHRA